MGFGLPNDLKISGDSKSDCGISCSAVDCGSPVLPTYQCSSLTCPTISISDIKCGDVDLGSLHCSDVKPPVYSCPETKCPEFKFPEYKCPAFNCPNLPSCPQCSDVSSNFIYLNREHFNCNDLY